MATINQASISTIAESTFIATKVRVPHTGAVVPRPRLMERLEAALARPLTLVAAPAGSGKTTLLAAWAAATTRAVAWVSLDAADNDPVRFLSGVAAAFDAASLGSGEHVRRLLSASYPAGPVAVLTTLANEVNARDGQWALVLDDYHLIEETAIHEGIAYLVTHMPANLRVILSCRGDPPLPLASLRARNQLSEFRVADLRFSIAEAGALLAGLTGADLPEAEIIALTEYLEGWAAGLVLAGLARCRRAGATDDATVLSGEHRYIVDYFVDEILSRLDPEIERFLLRTSILDRLTAPLCDALLDEASSQAILEQLERANLFTFALDDQRRWFRYHHLFAEVLRYRLAQREPEQMPDLHRLAAEWHLVHGNDVAAAMRHLLAVPDPERAAAMIELHASALLARGEVRTLRGWIEALPEATVRERPLLCLRHAWALAHAGLPDAAEEDLRGVDRWLATADGAPDAPQLLGELVTLRSRLAVIRNEPERTIELAQQALAILPADDAPNRASLGLNLGGAYSAIGDLDAADRAYEDVIALGPAAGPLAAALALRYRADLEVVRGRLHSAARLYREATGSVFAQGGSNLPAKGIICEGLADLAYHQNDLATAEEQAREAIALGERGGEVVKIAVPALVTLAKVRQARGDSGGAMEAIERAIVLGYGSGPATWQARLWLRQGNVRAASDWARASGWDPAGAVNVRGEHELGTLARVLLAERRWEAAMSLAARLVEQSERLGRLGRAIEFLTVLAHAQQVAGRTGQAAATLARALTIACDEGFVRLFADEGPSLAPVLTRARGRLRRGDDREWRAAAFASTILAAITAESGNGTVEDRPTPAVSLIEPLSEREQEVLRLLAAGRSNQEIADALYVTVGTVKTHTHRIYAKLGVRGRTEAIARGREAGLLP